MNPFTDKKSRNPASLHQALEGDIIDNTYRPVAVDHSYQHEGSFSIQSIPAVISLNQVTKGISFADQETGQDRTSTAGGHDSWIYSFQINARVDRTAAIPAMPFPGIEFVPQGSISTDIVCKDDKQR